MFIRQTTHDREIAIKDAEIAGLMARLERANGNWQRAMANEVKTALIAAERGKEVRRVSKFLPPKAKIVLQHMHADCGYAVRYISDLTGLPEKEVRVIIRGFEAYGWAFRHPFFSEDNNLIRGSGYSLTNEGWDVRQALVERAA